MESGDTYTTAFDLLGCCNDYTTCKVVVEVLVPYIKQDRRQIVYEEGAETVGELTYLFCREIKSYLQTKGESYQVFAEVLGALEGAKLDFIERKVKAYEQRKCLENGDVW